MEEETKLSETSAADKKSIALKLVKDKYEEFYNNNAARAPEKVNKIKYFLNWLKTATESDIEVEEVEFFMRKCEFETQVEFSNSSTRYYQTLQVTTFIASDPFYAANIRDVFYNPEANTKVVPANLNEMAEKEAKNILIRANGYVSIDNFHIQRYTIDDPQKDTFWKCTLTYPVGTNSNGMKKTLEFVCWDNVFFLSNIENLGEQEKSGGASTGGCYIATAVYGSYDCPQVWTLRRYRDYTLGSTRRGRLFIKLYYAISPTFVKWFGNTAWFKKFWRKKLDKKVNKLNSHGVENSPYEDKTW